VAKTYKAKYNLITYNSQPN